MLKLRQCPTCGQTELWTDHSHEGPVIIPGNIRCLTPVEAWTELTSADLAVQAIRQKRRHGPRHPPRSARSSL